jgi:hypothetical protein
VWELPLRPAFLLMTNTMAAQRNSKHKKLKVKAGNEPTLAAEKAKTGTKSARTRIKEKKRATPKSRESLTKAQKASQAAPRKVKQAHQARIKRVSFIVRLTVDKISQPGRTEIEHVPSGRKQNFPSLEPVRLITFMKACIGPERISEDVIPSTNTPEELITSISASAEPRASLIVSDVQVFYRGNPDFMTMMLTPEEPFILQAHFQINLPNAQALTFQESSFETKIYVSEISNGNSQLLKTYSAKLIQDVFNYTVPMDVDGLPLGLYRLLTVVTLHKPIKLVGFYGRTFIHIR